MILLYGYNAIRDFAKKAEDVTYLKFVNSLENAVRQSSGYGDISIKDFTLSGYEKICFVDLSDAAVTAASGKDLCTSGKDDYDPVICDGWQDRKQNVFLKPMAPTPIKVWTITVDGGDSDIEEDTSTCSGEKCFYRCFDISNGKLRLKLEGKGNRVIVSEAPVG